MNFKTNFEEYCIKDLNQALRILNLSFMDQEATDPKKMKQVLSDIGLDLEKTEFKKHPLLQRLANESIPIKPLRDKIVLGISKNPPLALTLIEASQSLLQNRSLVESLDPNRDATQQIHYATYFAVILEVLTRTIVNDKELEKSIVSHLLENRGTANPGSSFLNLVKIYKQTRKTLSPIGSLFIAIKTISVDAPMFSELFHREFGSAHHKDKAIQFIQKNHLTGLNARIVLEDVEDWIHKKRHYGTLCGNILEAIIQEEATVNKTSFFFKNKDKKRLDNAAAGLALILYLEKFEEKLAPNEYIKKNFTLNRILGNEETQSNLDFWNSVYNYNTQDNLIRTKKGMPQEWANLYEAWNISFVIRCFPENLHLFLPKLLIPDTLACPAEEYTATRLISLWLTLNFFESMIAKGVKTTFKGRNYEFFIDIFGKNNLEYAQKSLFKSDVDLESLYKEHIQSKTQTSLYLKAFKIIQGDYLFPR